MEKKKRGAGLILTSLFAALICAGCFIQIPLPGGIPIVIQDMMAFLSGLLLGPILGSAAVLIFIIIDNSFTPLIPFICKFSVRHSREYCSS